MDLLSIMLHQAAATTLWSSCDAACANKSSTATEPSTAPDGAAGGGGGDGDGDEEEQGGGSMKLNQLVPRNMVLIKA